MTRFSSSYSDLMGRFQEIETIISMARSTGRDPSRRYSIERTNILCRSGVVLLSSHVEAYIKGLGELAIERIATRQIRKDSLAMKFKYHLSRDLVRSFGTGTDPHSEAIKLDRFIKRDLHIWDDSPEFAQPLLAENIVGRSLTPNHSNISTFFGRFGFDTFDGELGRVLKAQHPICVNAINSLVSERNKIAHGDHLAVGTPSELQDAYKLIKTYCRGTDIAVGNWFRDIGCSIR